MAARKGQRITAVLGADFPPNLDLGVEAVQVGAGMIDEHFEQLGLPSLLTDLGADCYLNPTFSIPALNVGIPYVSVIHDVVFEDHPDWVELQLGDYLRRWSRFSALHAEAVIAVSDHAKGRIQAVYGVPNERIVRIYNGIDDNSFARPSPMTITNAINRLHVVPPFVLCLGSCEPKKGTPELLRAFETLVSLGFPGTLVLAGGISGPNFDLAALIAESRVHERIIPLGYVGDADKQALLAAADLLVYPSRYEGFGLPPLEALALGTPCVVNDATSLPEVVGEVGIRVDIGDPVAFAQAMLCGLNDRELRETVKTAGPRQARRFTWKTAAAQYWAVCEAAVAVGRVR